MRYAACPRRRCVRPGPDVGWQDLRIPDGKFQKPYGQPVRDTASQRVYTAREIACETFAKRA